VGASKNHKNSTIHARQPTNDYKVGSLTWKFWAKFCRKICKLQIIPTSSKQILTQLLTISKLQKGQEEQARTIQVPAQSNGQWPPEHSSSRRLPAFHKLQVRISIQHRLTTNSRLFPARKRCTSISRRGDPMQSSSL
jgi:hypothetical protein